MFVHNLLVKDDRAWQRSRGARALAQDTTVRGGRMALPLQPNFFSKPQKFCSSIKKCLCLGVLIHPRSDVATRIRTGVATATTWSTDHYTMATKTKHVHVYTNRSGARTAQERISRTNVHIRNGHVVIGLAAGAVVAGEIQRQRAAWRGARSERFYLRASPSLLDRGHRDLDLEAFSGSPDVLVASDITRRG